MEKMHNETNVLDQYRMKLISRRLTRQAKEPACLSTKLGYEVPDSGICINATGLKNSATYLVIQSAQNFFMLELIPEIDPTDFSGGYYWYREHEQWLLTNTEIGCFVTDDITSQNLLERIVPNLTPASKSILDFLNQCNLGNFSEVPANLSKEREAWQWDASLVREDPAAAEAACQADNVEFEQNENALQRQLEQPVDKMQIGQAMNENGDKQAAFPLVLNGKEVAAEDISNPVVEVFTGQQLEQNIVTDQVKFSNPMEKELNEIIVAGSVQAEDDGESNEVENERDFQQQQSEHLIVENDADVLATMDKILKIIDTQDIWAGDKDPLTVPSDEGCSRISRKRKTVDFDSDTPVTKKLHLDSSLTELTLPSAMGRSTANEPGQANQTLQKLLCTKPMTQTNSEFELLTWLWKNTKPKVPERINQEPNNQAVGEMFQPETEVEHEILNCQPAVQQFKTMEDKGVQVPEADIDLLPNRHVAAQILPTVRNDNGTFAKVNPGANPPRQRRITRADAEIIASGELVDKKTRETRKTWYPDYKELLDKTSSRNSLRKKRTTKRCNGHANKTHQGRTKSQSVIVSIDENSGNIGRIRGNQSSGLELGNKRLVPLIKRLTKEEILAAGCAN